MKLKIILLTVLYLFSCNLHQETGILPELLMLKQSTSSQALSVSYSSSSISYTKYLAATTIPTITGGTVTSCTISPTLPTGLSIDNSCVISGTPTEWKTAADYTVTASNDTTSTTTILNITSNFMRQWSEIQPILQEQAAKGVSGTETTYTFGTFTGTDPKWYGGVLAPNGKIYAIPANRTDILVINPADDSTYTFGNHSGSNKWYGGVLAPNGKIYGVPRAATNVLVIDPSIENSYTICEGLVSGDQKWGGVIVASNGKLYGIPRYATEILVIDPDTDTCSSISSTSGSHKWVGGVLSPNGKIFGIPFNSSTALLIDPETISASTFGSVSSSTGKWASGALTPGGFIYGLYWSASTGTYIKIDTNSNNITTPTAPNDSGFNSLILAPNGKLYGIPSYSSYIRVIDPKSNGTWPSDLYLSPYFNKM